MKAKIVETKFEPVTVQITLENEEDVKRFVHKMTIEEEGLNSGYMRRLRFPPTEWRWEDDNIYSVLDKLIRGIA